jgi:hypothetical protein
LAVILLLATLGDRPAHARRFTGSVRLIVPGHSFAAGPPGLGFVSMIGGSLSAVLVEWVELEAGASFLHLFNPEVVLVARAGVSPRVLDQRQHGGHWVLRIPALAGYRWQYLSGEHEGREFSQSLHCVTFDAGLAATRWWKRVGLELRLVGELIVVLTNVEEHSTASTIDHGGGVGGGGTFTLGLSF